MKLRRIAYGLLPALLLALAATPASAEDGAGQDTKAKIKAKMEKILELMKANEKALIEMSVGKDAKPKRVDIDVPPPDGASSSSSGGSGSSGSGGAGSGGAGSSGAGGEGAAGGATGIGAAKKLEELMRDMQAGGTIPGELKQLVEMIPT